MSDYLHKSVTFNKTVEQDKKLHEWLRSIGHGEFNRKTKEYWLDVMQKESTEDGK